MCTILNGLFLHRKPHFFRTGVSASCTNALEVWDIKAQVMLSSALPALQRSALAVIGYGSKLFIAGGNLCAMKGAPLVDTVTIYDADTDTTSETTLSSARRGLIAGKVQDLILFAGAELPVLQFLDLWISLFF